MIGRLLGRYRIVSLLGTGGMGEVYRARDTQLDRDVAVKILPEGLERDPEALRRFEREAKAVAALSHPNILAIHDIGSADGVHYAVMELLEGETLRAHLARGRIPWRRALEIGVEIGEGLAAAHAKGIVHRDLKPENVMLTREARVKILDFGLARVSAPVTADDDTVRDDAEGRTRTGVVMGTVGYMSPEQARGETVDARSDLFSFGCMLCEMLTGVRPFARASSAESIAALLHEEPAGLERADPDIPEEAARVLRHCLEKEPSERFQSVRDLVFDLKSLLGEPVSERARRGRSRSRPRVPWAAIASGSGIALLVAAGALFVSLRHGRAIDSLAVLPLSNPGGDADTEYLSDGITESLIDNLSQLPALRVMARSTVFSFKGQRVDPRAVGRRLNVRAVLSGRVVVRGGMLSILAELVNVADGSQLWGHRYEQPLHDILELQTDIARQIADQLRVALTGKQRERLSRKYTQNPEAYLLYARGRYQMANSWSEDGFHRGVGLLQQAIALDPAYALPHAGLATTYYEASSVVLPPETAMPLAKASAMNALRLDESLAEAHTALALEQAYYEWDWTSAKQHLQRAIAVNPNYSQAHLYYGILMIEVDGATEAGIKQIREAVRLDPLTPSTSMWLAIPYYLDRRYDEAVREIQKLTQTQPDFYLGRSILGNIYEYQGKLKEAIAEYQRARELNPRQPYTLGYLGHAYGLAGDREKALAALREMDADAGSGTYVDPVARATLLAGLGDKGRTLDALEDALAKRSENLAHWKDAPTFDLVRAEPRFRAILRRMNLER